MSDYIPQRDTEFLEWLNQLTEGLSGPGVPGHLPAELVQALVAVRQEYGADLQAHVNAHAASAAARQVKDITRRRAVDLCRQAARILQADGAVTDIQRATLGLPIRDKIRTPVPPPWTAPSVTVDASQRFRHTLHIRDRETAARRARPRGTVGCEVWMRVGLPESGNGTAGAAAVGDPAGMRMVGLATGRPRTVTFTAADLGRTAYYQCRWVNRRGETGPWSQLVSATIPG